MNDKNNTTNTNQSILVKAGNTSNHINRIIGLAALLIGGVGATYAYLFINKSDELSINISTEYTKPVQVVSKVSNIVNTYSGEIKATITNVGDENQLITYSEFSIFTLSPDKISPAKSEAGSLRGPMPYTKCFNDSFNYGWIKENNEAYANSEQFKEILNIREQTDTEVTKDGGTTGWLNSKRTKHKTWDFSFNAKKGGAYLIRYYYEVDTHKKSSRKHQCIWVGAYLPKAQ